MLRRSAPLFGVFALLAACTSSATRDASQADTAPIKNVCDQANPANSLSSLFSTPIVPPRPFGADSAWGGLTIDDMQAAFCTADTVSEDETTITAGWGRPNGYAVQVQWLKDTRQVDSFQLNAGYEGTLDFASRPTAIDDSTKKNPFGNHTYSIGVGRPLQRDGQTFLLDWTNIDAQATEIYDALLYTFALELRSTQTSCVEEQLCLARMIGDGQAVFGARPLGIYFEVDTVNEPQPGPSTPTFLYGFPLKMTPFSQADVLLKLDDEGPIATAAAIGQTKSLCTMKLGMTFSAFEQSCIDVMGDPADNDALAQKIEQTAKRVVSTTSTAALDATWTFDVTGLHPNFASERFDEQSVAPDAPANELVLDDRSIGSVLNDFDLSGHPTMSATAAIYGEYARQVQAFVQANMDASLPRHNLGDPQCLSQTPAPGCTGIEQLLIPADPSATTDPGLQRLSVGVTTAEGLGVTTALRPGPTTIVFCSDPGPDAKTQDQHCNTTSGSASAGQVESTRSQIITVLGGGDETKLPAALLDRTAYVRLWAKALTKYLRAAPQNPTDLGTPNFDALTPSDADITATSIHGTLLSVTYKDKLELQVDFLTGNISQFIFR